MEAEARVRVYALNPCFEIMKTKVLPWLVEEDRLQQFKIECNIQQRHFIGPFYQEHSLSVLSKKGLYKKCAIEKEPLTAVVSNSHTNKMEPNFAWRYILKYMENLFLCSPQKGHVSPQAFILSTASLWLFKTVLFCSKHQILYSRTNQFDLLIHIIKSNN